ncbi:hypothetical protein KI387_008186 [Taxus chinensis]|uniref:Helicase MOV-10-like beta-barrel domain-containing protein n=1 Tax=Taxus chinensis TaxID=29808 RepID=A0AA38CQ72_TAXCH|nr:hypothetical protein KI387_008186 [Taxus chinensis]
MLQIKLNKDSGYTGMRGVALDKNEVREMGSLVIKDGPSDEHKQKQSGNAGIFKGQTDNQDSVSENLREGDICVSYPFPLENGRQRSIEQGGEQTSCIVITNNGKNSVKLFAVKIPSEGLKGVPWLIEPKHHLNFHLSYMAKDIGLHSSSILFDFQDHQNMRHEDDVSEQLAADMNAYYMHDVTTNTHGQYLALKVPGLFGKRPSLVQRDLIYVTSSCEEGNTYQSHFEMLSPGSRSSMLNR